MGPEHLAANAAMGKAMHDNIVAGGPQAYDGTYWQERTTTPQMAAKIVNNGIPALLWSGWKALDVTGSLELFSAFQNAATGRPVNASMTPGQKTSGKYQIIVGRGIHGQGLDQSLMLEWYDTWLKHVKTGMADTKTPAHVYETGSDRWVNAPSYPMTAKYTPYYLHGRSTLSPQPPTAATGTNSITWAAPTEPNSTLTYSSAAFAQGASLDGPIAASIYASSSNKNLELIATLTDVAPDGSTVKLTNGTVLGSLSAIDKTSWRDSAGMLTKPVHPYAADHYVPAGQLHRYDIKLTPVVHAVAPGHSLRLTLSTQSWLSDCLNPVGPTQPCLLTAPQKATVPGGVYQIERGNADPSVINLPLLPAGTFATAPSGVTPTSLGETEPLGW
jgi:predicted acyl esterase